MTTATPSGFIGWISTYGGIIAFFVQMVFYVVVAAAAAWAAIMFARFVKYTTADETVIEVTAPPAPESSDVSVEEFVE